MNKLGKQLKSTNWVHIVILCVLVLYAVLLLVPAVWTIMSSFKSVDEWDWDNN